MIYAINVCVPTKSGDRYEIVAINNYPIIVMGEEECYKEILLSSQMTEYIEQNVSKNLRQRITFKIRQLDEYIITDISLPIQDLEE